MRSGRMYRYNSDSAETCEVSLCEDALAEYTGHKYCVALNSCGSAIFLALKCAGAGPGTKVLSNAFTFTAVPSAIVHAGAEPVYVECTDNYLMDVADLEKKADETGAKILVLSYMRGKVSDMDAIVELCEKRGIEIIEDCAHALGVYWEETHMGKFGTTACYSSQSYKMLNSGEGGFLCTDDEDVAAKAILYAGSYEKLHLKHLRAPPVEAFQRQGTRVPNFSLRMHGVTAAIIRPQIATLEPRVAEYNARYAWVAERMRNIPGVEVPDQLPKVRPAADSLQFNILSFSQAQIEAVCARCADGGVPVEVFGADGNARNFRNWGFEGREAPAEEDLAMTYQTIRHAFDVRLPLTFTDDDIEIMIEVMEDAIRAASAM